MCLNGRLKFVDSRTNMHIENNLELVNETDATIHVDCRLFSHPSSVYDAHEKVFFSGFGKQIGYGGSEIKDSDSHM